MQSNSAITNTNDLICRELLLNLEDDPNNPNTIKKLHKKIEELEAKILEQRQNFKKRELELYHELDHKTSKWIFRYLEMKLQMENYKAFYQQGKQLWQRDCKNLYNLIQDLLKKIKEKDEQYLNILRALDRECSIIANANNSYNNIQHSLSNKQISEFNQPRNSDNMPNQNKDHNNNTKPHKEHKKNHKITIRNFEKDLTSITIDLPQPDKGESKLKCLAANTKLLNKVLEINPQNPNLNTVKLDELSIESDSYSNINLITKPAYANGTNGHSYASGANGACGIGIGIGGGISNSVNPNNIHYFLSPRNMMNTLTNPKLLLDITANQKEKARTTSSKKNNNEYFNHKPSPVCNNSMTSKAIAKKIDGLLKILHQHIIETNQKIANQQLIFDDEINMTLKRVQPLIKSSNSQPTIITNPPPPQSNNANTNNNNDILSHPLDDQFPNTHSINLHDIPYHHPQKGFDKYIMNQSSEIKNKNPYLKLNSRRNNISNALNMYFKDNTSNLSNFNKKMANTVVNSSVNVLPHEAYYTMDNQTKVVDNQIKDIDNQIRNKENQPKVMENQPKAFDNQSRAVDNQYKAFDNQLRDIDSQPKAFDNQNRVMDNQYKAFDSQLKAMDNQPRAFDSQLRAIDNQSKAFDSQLRNIDNHPKAMDNQSRVMANQLKTVDNYHNALDNHLNAMDNKPKSMDNQPKTMDNHLKGTDNHPQAPDLNTQPDFTIDNNEKSLNIFLSKFLGMAPGALGKHDIEKLFHDIQNSLSFSEREAVLCTLLNARDDTLNEENEIKLQDLLAVSPSQNFSSFGNIIPSLHQTLSRHNHYHHHHTISNDDNGVFQAVSNGKEITPIKNNGSYIMCHNERCEEKKNNDNLLGNNVQSVGKDTLKLDDTVKAPTNQSNILNSAVINSKLENLNANHTIDKDNLTLNIEFYTPAETKNQESRIFLNGTFSSGLNNPEIKLMNKPDDSSSTNIFKNISPIKPKSSTFASNVSKRIDFDHMIIHNHSKSSSQIVHHIRKEHESLYTPSLHYDIDIPMISITIPINQEKENIPPLTHGKSCMVPSKPEKPTKLLPTTTTITTTNNTNFHKSKKPIQQQQQQQQQQHHSHSTYGLLYHSKK